MKWMACRILLDKKITRRIRKRTRGTAPYRCEVKIDINANLTNEERKFGKHQVPIMIGTISVRGLITIMPYVERLSWNTDVMGLCKTWLRRIEDDLLSIVDENATIQLEKIL